MKTYDPKKVGQRIKDLMEKNGYNTNNICNSITDKWGYSVANPNPHLNMSKPTLKKILDGQENSASFYQMMDICNFFHVSMDYLLGESDYTNKEADIAGKYCGLSPESVSLLHDKYYDDFHIFLDYLLMRHSDQTALLLKQFGSAIMCNSFNVVYEQCVEQSDILVANDLFEKFISLYSGENLEKDNDMVSVHRLQMQDTIKAIIDSVHPLSIIYWAFGKSYYDAEQKGNKKNQKIFKDALSTIEEIHKAFSQQAK